MANRRAAASVSELENAAKVATAHGVIIAFETPDGRRVTIAPGAAASGGNDIDKMLGLA